MNITSLKIAYFSPTGTTLAVLRGIARGIGLTPERFDLTTPAARASTLRVGAADLLVLGVPVYMGRVPDILSDWFARLDLDRTPTVCVVVYGNRAYEDALLELKDLVSRQGGLPIAAAAFIGEHSFSSAALPASVGRPDAHDLAQAEEFGRRLRERGSCPRPDPASAHPLGLLVPGSFPYRGTTKLWDVDFIQVGDACVHCGVCAEHCPAGAIDPADSARVDTVKCLTCCACIKRCPRGARDKKPGPVADAAWRVHTRFSKPQHPEFFFEGPTGAP